MMKKRGFTLIELLGVIVVLAIISLIALPKVHNLISNAKYTGAIESVQGYIMASNALSTTSRIEVTNNKYMYETGSDDELDNVEISGSVPTYVFIKYDTETKKVSKGAFCVNGYNLDYIDGIIKKSESDYCKTGYQKKIISITGKIVGTNTVKIEYEIEDTTNIKEYICYYSKDESYSNYVIGNSSSCTIEGLKNNEKYNYKACAVKNDDTKECEEGIFVTKDVSIPRITAIRTPQVSQNGYFKAIKMGITYVKGDVENPVYYVKTTKKASINKDAYSCGNSTMPSSCLTTSVTTLESDNWYKVEENVELTYTENIENDGTIYALTTDGNNYSDAATSNIGKIDTESPSLTIESEIGSSNAIVIDYQIVENKSGINKITCRYGKTTSYGNNGNASEDLCVLTNLEKNQKYYYEVCAKDNLENENCVTGEKSTVDVQNPIITNINTPEEAINGYLKKQVIHIEYEKRLENPLYYIKSTRSGILSDKTVSECGNGENPSNCTKNQITDIEAGIWYRVSGDIDITYDTLSIIVDEITAVEYDGELFIGAAMANISRIDTKEPIVTLGTKSSKTNSIRIDYSISDLESGIDSYTCRYREASGLYQSISSTISRCEVSGLKNNQTYYFEVCAEDKIGNKKCVETNTNTKDFKEFDVIYEPKVDKTYNGYYKSHKIIIGFNDDDVTTPVHYIKSTRNGTIKEATVAVCGVSNEPGECTTNVTTEILKDYWYKIDEDAEILYEETTSKDDDYVIALITDGTNIKKSGTLMLGKIDNSKPEIRITNTLTTTNSIEIRYIITDEYTDIKSYSCSYGLDETYGTESDNKTTNSCKIEGLKNNTVYYYQICAEDNVGNIECIVGTTKTNEIKIPEVKYKNPTEKSINGYFKTKTIEIKYNDENISNPIYYIKSDREGSINKDAYSCGNDVMPGTCGTTKTKSINVDTWYKVEKEVEVTYSETSDELGGLIALITDGTNYKESVTITIPLIDQENPKAVILKGVTTLTNNAVIKYQLEDTKSGVGEYTCKYSKTSGTYNINGNSKTNAECIITDLENTETYYYEICVSDKLENGPVCNQGSFTTKDFINPEIKYNKTTGTSVNGYLREQIISVIFDTTNMGSTRKFYIKSDRDGKVSFTRSNCGIGDKPGTCVFSNVSTLSAGVWYEILGNIDVTYDTDSTNDDQYLYTYISDGTNFDENSGYAVGTISKIEHSDPEAPEIKGGSSTWTSTARTIKIKTAGSAVSDVATYEYYKAETNTAPTDTTTATGTTSGDLIVSDEGTRYIWYRTKSKAGNRSAWSNYQVSKLDTQTPSTPTLTASDGITSGNWHTSGFDLIIGEQNNLSGNTYYFGRNTYATTSSETTTSRALACNGETASYTYYVMICSGAGLCSGQASYQVKEELNVSTPTITYNGGSNTNSWKNNYNLTLSSSSLSGISYYEIDYTGDDIAETSTGANFIPSNGWNAVTKFRAVSNVGNRSSWTDGQYIHMDTGVPGTTTITYNSGQNAAIWQNNINISLSATDNVGISYYEIDWDGNDVADTDTNLMNQSGYGNSISNFVPWNGWASGNTRFRAVDYAGNKGAWSSVANIYMDTGAPGVPTITYNSGANAGIWQNNINITLASTDNVGVAYYQLDTNSDNQPDANTAANYIPTYLNSGSVRFRAVDHAGNPSDWSGGVYIAADTTNPTHTNWWWGEVTKDVARLYIQVTDDLSGVPNGGTINVSLYNGHNVGIYCPTSTATGGYANWYYFPGVWDAGANAFRCDITPATFGHYGETYATHLYIWDYAGNGGYYNQTSVAIPASCTFTSQDFAYTGGVQSWTVPTGCGGTYKLEVWGSQGEAAGKGYGGGNGGYSQGYVNLNERDSLKVVVGGISGYNGGGIGPTPISDEKGGNGGGATHIAKADGEYTTLETYGNATNAINYVYIVAGGGGGGAWYYAGEGGGLSGGYGGPDSPESWQPAKARPGTQTSGYAFGKGENGHLNSDDYRSSGAGGGGWYGGYGDAYIYGGWSGGGGGGSGYIGGVTNGSTQSGVQSGNGYAKITKVG